MMDDHLLIISLRTSRIHQLHAFDHSMELAQTVILIRSPHSDVHVTYIPAAKSVWRQNHFAKSQEAGLEVLLGGRQQVQVKLQLKEAPEAATIQAWLAKVQQGVAAESPGGRMEVELVRAWQDLTSMDLFCVEGLGLLWHCLRPTTGRQAQVPEIRSYRS
jgi:hypothetical protein